MIRVLAIDLDGTLHGTLLRSDILPTHKRMGLTTAVFTRIFKYQAMPQDNFFRHHNW